MYEVVVYRENNNFCPFRKLFEKLFAMRQKNIYENYDVLQFSLKLLTSSLYGEQTRKNIKEKLACKSEYWMLSEHDERVKHYRKISHHNYTVKVVDDTGLADEGKKWTLCHFT